MCKYPTTRESNVLQLRGYAIASDWADTVLFPHETGSEAGQNLHVEEAKLGDC